MTSDETKGLCECGCGEPTPIAKVTRTARGQVKGQPVRFIHGHNSRGMDRTGPRKVHFLEEDRGYKTPCWIWQLARTVPNRVSKGGYGKMGFKGKDYLAHRWYYEQKYGHIPAGKQLDHLCRVPACVNPDHMEPVTPLENTRRSQLSKLSIEQAREIERLARSGISSYEIAPMFNVTHQTVSLIRRSGADAARRSKDKPWQWSNDAKPRMKPQT